MYSTGFFALALKINCCAHEMSMTLAIFSFYDVTCSPNKDFHTNKGFRVAEVTKSGLIAGPLEFTTYCAEQGHESFDTAASHANSMQIFSRTE